MKQFYYDQKRDKLIEETGPRTPPGFTPRQRKIIKKIGKRPPVGT